MALPFSTLDGFYAGALPHLAAFDAFCTKHGLAGRAKPDHFCYKCDSSESFEAARALFETEAPYLYQSIISNRRIAIVKLGRPLETVLGPIHFLELSDQKPDGSQANAYDHIEVYATDRSYDEFVEELSRDELVIEEKRPHHSTHGIALDGEFLFRTTQGPLIDKIKAEEMR